MGFDTVFKIDDKPDFLIFPQRFCFGKMCIRDSFKIMKPKKDAAKGSSNLDDLDFDEDDEEEEELETEQADEEV